MSTAADYSESRQTIGSILRQARVRHGHDIETMAQLLRIRQPFLEAIEQGRYDLLPGPTYATGFIRAYAEQLGLDGTQFVQRYREETLANPQAVELQFPSPVAESSKPTGRMIAIGLIGLVLAYGAWNLYEDSSLSVSDWIPPIPDQFASLLPGMSPEIETGSEPAAVADGAFDPLPPASPVPAERAETAPAPAAERTRDGDTAAPGDLAEVASEGREAAAENVPPAASADGAVAANETPAPVGADPATSAEGADPAIDAGAVGEEEDQPGDDSSPAGVETDPTRVFGDTTEARIVLRATQDSWIEVRDESRGELLLARLMRPGDVYLVPNRSGLTLLTGNAGGLNVYVDGNPAPPLGKGGVVRRGIALDADALRGEAPPQ